MSSPENIFKKVDSGGNTIAYFEDQINSQYLNQNSNSITVVVTNDAQVNGNNLLAAYTAAKSMTPNQNPLSSTNRLAIILPPSIYDLGTQSLILDTQYIDIIGSTSDRDKHYITSNVDATSNGTLMQTENDIKLYNLTIENSNTSHSPNYDDTDPVAYFPNSNLPLAYLENIKFLANDNNVFSMRTSIQYSGTYINCTGGLYAFGGGEGNGGTLSGTFKDCTGGDLSFGCGFTGGTLSGTFTNCTGGFYAFGGGSTGGNLTSTSKFTNCTGGNYSFGGGLVGGILSGIFTNCTGGTLSFGGGDSGNGALNGTFTNCTGGFYAFGGGEVGGTLSGTFKDCTGGNYSFGGGEYGGNLTSTSVFTNCTGGNYSFGGADGGTGGTLKGTFTNCTGGIGSFNL